MYRWSLKGERNRISFSYVVGQIHLAKRWLKHWRSKMEFQAKALKQITTYLDNGPSHPSVSCTGPTEHWVPLCGDPTETKWRRCSVHQQNTLDACCFLQILDLLTNAKCTDADLPFHYWQLSASPFQFLTSVTLDLEHKEQNSVHMHHYITLHYITLDGSVGEATYNYEYHYSFSVV